MTALISSCFSWSLASLSYASTNLLFYAFQLMISAFNLLNVSARLWESPSPYFSIDLSHPTNVSCILYKDSYELYPTIFLFIPSLLLSYKDIILDKPNRRHNHTSYINVSQWRLLHLYKSIQSSMIHNNINNVTMMQATIMTVINMHITTMHITTN